MNIDVVSPDFERLVDADLPLDRIADGSRLRDSLVDYERQAA